MRHKLFLAMLFSFAGVMAHADVTMPKIFGDNMVLQQDIAIPVWGKAAPGEKVTVTLDSTLGTAVAGKDGKWMVKLAPQKVTGKPAEMTVEANNKLKFTNILIGNVWVASGQSNMEWPLSRVYFGEPVIANASKTPEIRVFLVERNCSFTPLDEINGSWKVSSPESVKDFSAVAYFFALDLLKATKEPIGLIGTYWGGTNAKTWISKEKLESDFPHYAKQLDDYIAKLPEATKEYKETIFPKYEKDLKLWQEKHEEHYKTVIAAFHKRANAERAAGTDPAPPPSFVRRPRAPQEPGPNAWQSSNLFNAMLNPIIPFAIRGVIWYQGEANAYSPEEYEKLMSALISDWRTRWDQGDFPFYFVQLANYTPRKAASEYSSWARVRESQAKNLAIPATGMAVAVDIGETHDIHPHEKKLVGERLALWEKLRLGQKDIKVRGPLFDRMKIKGSSVEVTFKNVAELQTKDGGKEVKGFALAGDDGFFYWAKATLTGKNTVLVSCPEVKDPVAVRYAWADNPETNLYDETKLPAEPFRTDSWDKK